MKIRNSMKVSRHRKAVILILSLMSLFTSISVWGQRNVEPMQKGYVKTKGRMGNDGTIVHGLKIPGTTIQVKGRTAVLSQPDGTFSFPIPSKRYYLQNVQKRGYVLADPEILSRSFEYSTNPLVLVLETLSQQADDKLAAERQVRRSLQKQLRLKEEEIEELKQKKQITDEKYRELLQTLYSKQENNERLISQMVQKYTQMDYDQIDSLDCLISEAILNGQLIKADSLLRSKGSMRDRVEEIMFEQQIETEEEKLLAKRQVDLNLSKAGTNKKMENVASDCHKFFDRFCLTQQYDSAAFYLNIRSELDTTNINYLLESIDFEKEFISDGWEMTKYKRALDISLKFYGEQSWEYALCCNRIGNEISEESYKTADFAEKYLKVAHNIIDSIYGDNHLEMARCYLSYGKMYSSESCGIYSNDTDWEKDVELAKDYLIKAVNIYKKVNPTGLLDIAKCYMLLYDVCGEEEFNEMAFNIYKSINKGQNAGTAFYYYKKGLKFYENENLLTPSLYGYFFENISNFDDHTAIRKEIKNYKKSIPLLRKAQDIYIRAFGINYPMVDEVDYIIDQIETEIQLFNRALKYSEPIQILYNIWNNR